MKTTELKPMELEVKASKSDVIVFEDINDFARMLNKAPRKEWIKTNPYSNNAKYIPIGIVEALLRRVFVCWQVEHVGTPYILGNSVVANVNLKVWHPILKEWVGYAGTGAVPIELAGGSNPLDFEKINPKALHKNVPAALSFAISNAAKKIGVLFGSQLNRPVGEML